MGAEFCALVLYFGHQEFISWFIYDALTNRNLLLHRANFDTENFDK